MSDREKWEARYVHAAAAGEHPPSELLTQHRDLLPPGRALDVASGDGRHALWLARQGYAVDAFDLSHAGLLRLLARGRHEHLAIHAIQANLEDFPLPTTRYAVVVNTYYLQRSLFPALRRAVRPGGAIVFETFLREQARIGHPRNPAFLLEPGELRAAFAGFEMLVDEEGCFAGARGPAYLARLIARRPSQGDLD
ncbi:class I SAM-dependent methyltransferase [bacterium]|nr:class I SAM-dependent methyltransferase [bacterium]